MRRSIDNLLAMRGVIDLAADAADGLDFAAKQNFFRRDIKPENIMYEPDSDTVNITDFGISLVTESSKTKTGMVLGTPSCTSPEQPARKKLVGHSNLFSLGVMCYQNLSGALPFKTGSMASLMFEISYEAAADIRSAHSVVPGAFATVINKVTMNNVELRFPGAADFANTVKVSVKPWSRQLDESAR